MASFCRIERLLFQNNNVTKAPPTGFTGRSNTTVENASVQLLEESNTDGPVTHAWSVTPDVIEGGHGKIAAPEQSDTHATEICQDRVAAAFSTLEALVRVTPHTVSGSNCFRFSDDILKSYLKWKSKKIDLGLFQLCHLRTLRQAFNYSQSIK